MHRMPPLRRLFFFTVGRALAAAALALPALAGAQSTPPPPAERFFGAPELRDATLSPSGRRLALTTTRGADRVGLLVIELDGPPRAVRAAQFRDADVVSFQWVDDERLVFTVADLEAGSGEDRYVGPGLYAVNADGSAMRQLIKRRAVRGAVVNAPGWRLDREALDPDHSLLHVPDAAPGEVVNEVIVGRNVVNGGEVVAIAPLWLDVRSGRTRGFDVASPPEGAIEWWFDGAGRPRAAMSRRDGRARVHWRGPGSDEWKLIHDTPVLQMRWAPRFVDDVGGLFVAQPRGPAGETVLSRFDFERGAPSAEPWVAAPGFDFRGSVVGGRRDVPLLGVRVESDAESTVWFDERMKRLQDEADRRWPGHVNRLSCRRCGEAGMTALVMSYADRDPGTLWLFREATGRWQSVMRVNEAIDPAAMARVDFRRIRARDGRDLPVWLTFPPGVDPAKVARPLPTVVLVHGGPWVRGGHWRWSPMEQFLASRGWLVVSPEFRGSQGYGAAHLRAGYKQWGRAMQDDVADALLWARREGLAGERACIAGASYGGYSTLMGLVRHPDLYRCGAAWVAVTDPFLILDSPWWLRDDIGRDSRRYSLPEMVGDAKADAEMLTAVSPVAQAARITAPLLLAFGESDVRVPLLHGTRLREALRAAGREPEWVTYPNEGHSWRLLATQLDFAKRLERFLATHLTGAAEPPAAPK